MLFGRHGEHQASFLRFGDRQESIIFMNLSILLQHSANCCKRGHLSKHQLVPARNSAASYGASLNRLANRQVREHEVLYHA
jgi:hypothetical protein